MHSCEGVAEGDRLFCLDHAREGDVRTARARVIFHPFTPYIALGKNAWRVSNIYVKIKGIFSSDYPYMLK